LPCEAVATAGGCPAAAAAPPSPTQFSDAGLASLRGRSTVVKAPALSGPPARRAPAVVDRVSETIASYEGMAAHRATATRRLDLYDAAP